MKRIIALFALIIPLTALLSCDGKGTNGSQLPEGPHTAFHLSGLEGMTITVLYTDNVVRQCRLDNTGYGWLYLREDSSSATIKSIIVSENRWLIGVDEGNEIVMTFSGPSELIFRSDVSDNKLVGTVAELVLIEDYPLDDYIQTRDLDLMEEAWTPICSSDKPFTGSFDGNSYELRNLNISRRGAEEVGLFGLNMGTLSNVIIESGSVTGRSCVGAICGVNYGVIARCENYASINTDGSFNNDWGNTGGICGENRGGVISECVNYGSLMTQLGENGRDRNTGGICGLNTRDGNNEGVIEKCNNQGGVIGNRYVGGICGRNESAIRDCANHSSVIAYMLGAGGIAGYCATGSLVQSSVNNSTITVNVGGLAGGICGSENLGIIRACVNKGDIYGNIIGGIVPDNKYEGTLGQCYNSGGLYSSSKTAGYGGICAFNSGLIEACYQTGRINYTGSSAWFPPQSDYVTGFFYGRNEPTGAINDSYYYDAHLSYPYPGKPYPNPPAEVAERVEVYNMADQWPADDPSTGWGIASGDPGAGSWWKSLGGISGITVTYPTLYWE